MSDPSLPPRERQPGPAPRPYSDAPGQPPQGQPHQGRPPQQYPQQPYPPQQYQQQPYQQQSPFAPAPQQPPPRFPTRRPNEETRRDVEAAWEARKELGREYEEHIAAGLAERVEELAAERAAQVYQESERTRLAARGEHSGRVRQFVLGIVSLALGVPITAIAGGVTEPNSLMGVAIAWGGIVGVNAVHALSSRRKKS
jgi:hypothetical protein